MARRLSLPHVPPQVLVAAGAALYAAIVVTLVTVGQMKLGLSLLGALVFVPLAFVNPPLALSVWLVTNLLAGIHFFGSASKRSLLVILLVWIGAVAAGGVKLLDTTSEAARLRRRQVTLFLIFLLWVLLTLVWAPDSGFASTVVGRLLMSGLVFSAVLTVVTEPQHVRYLAAAFVIGAVLSVLSGVVTGGLHTDASTASTLTSDEGRLRGGTSDPNYLAAAIVPAMMLAGALAFRRRQPIVRFLLLIAAIVLAIGLAATESRGGFIAVVVVGIGALLVWRERRLLIVAFMGVFIAGAAAFFIASPSAWQRVTSNTDKGSGRSDIWQVAWRIVETHPIAGVGLSQFPVVSPDYIRQPGALSRADLLVNQHIVVHNSYLQLWAEAGIVGLLLFLAIALTGLQACHAAARRFDARGDPEMATMARAALLALVGALAASFFLSNVDDQRFWVLIGLGPALLVIAQRDSRADAP
jgi:O-antigen ligase